jgi:hypothetical protein
MLVFASVGLAVGECCRSHLLLCSGCFAAIAILRQMLCHHVARAVVVPLSPPLLDRCFAAVSVMAPHSWMLCRVDGRRLRRMLCRRGLFSSGCFAAEVDAGLVAFAVFTTLLATDVSFSCIRPSQLGILGGVPLMFSCFLFMPIGFRW